MCRDKVKILITIDTGFPGADHASAVEVDRAEWEAMTPDERDKFMEPSMEISISNHINASYRVVED